MSAQAQTMRAKLAKFKSKYVWKISVFTFSFTVTLLLQCVLHLVSLLAPETFIDNFALIETFYLLLQLGSHGLVLMIFRGRVRFLLQ